MSWLKNFIKYHFVKSIHRDKLHPSIGIQQRQLMQQYLVCKQNKQLPDIKTTGFKVFSQFEEDGILLYLFSIIGEGSKTFIEIGANDGINSNCSNMAVHFGWSGLFFEGDPNLIKRGRKFYSKIPTPYDPNYMYPGKHPIYHGASVIAMNKLAQKKGYRLVAASDLGINQVFLRNDLAVDEIPAIDPASTLWHPQTIAGFQSFEVIKDWDYLEG